MPMATVEGGDLHYSLAGGGPPLVLLLPQSGGPVGIEPFVQALADNRLVIRYDQRGTGRSAPLSGPDAGGMTARAGEVASLLDALDIAQADLFCHSTGCGIGLSLAAAQGSRIRRLVLAAPWSHGDDFLTSMQRLRVAAARALAPPDYARFNASLLYPPEHRRRHANGFARQAATAAPQDPDAISDRLEAILAFDARPLLSGIGHPCLVATARDDQLMPPWLAREIAKALPRARLMEMHNGGHMLPETKSEALASTVDTFLEGSTGSSE